MTHSNNIEYMHPEVIDVCTNCKRLTCNNGQCEAVAEKIKELKARKPRNYKKERHRPGPPPAQYTYNGESHSLQEWAKILGINIDTIYRRKQKGGPQEAWFRPVEKGAKDAK